MMSAEDRARAAMRAIAATVDDAPPLRLAPTPGAPAPDTPVPHAPGHQPPDRGWHVRPRRTWIAPASAALAILAVGLTLGVVRWVPDRQTPQGTVSGPPDGVPRYYMSLGAPVSGSTTASATVVVGDTLSGQRLITVGPFAAGDATSVTAAADDRTFVVATEPDPGFGAADHGTPTWYLIRVTPDSRPGYSVSELRVHFPEGGYFSAMALSPDGTKLALAGSLDGTARRPAQTLVNICSVTTGELLGSWTQAQTGSRTPVGSLWWTTGERQLAFTYQTGTSGRDHVIEVRLLPVTSQGHDLIADSRSVWSTRASAARGRAPSFKSQMSCGDYAADVLVTADGNTIVCAAAGGIGDPVHPAPDACPGDAPRNFETIREYSTATGNLTRTVYTAQTSCFPLFSANGPTGVLWASDAGDAVIGCFGFAALPDGKPVVRFGIYGTQTFRPLPLPPTTRPGTIAW